MNLNPIFKGKIMLRLSLMTTHFIISIFLTVASLLSTKSHCADNSPIQLNDTLFFQTIHGDLRVEDPLAIELIQSPLMQRLNHVYQYGVNEFVLPAKAYHYTRFDHCLGVYQILKARGASRLEQIAGLLHDASHTVFSHTMDFLFMGGMNKGSYQDSIHAQFLKDYGAQEILEKHGCTIEDVLPDKPEFLCLEQPHPWLCADRIEYILHAGDLEGFMSIQEIQETHTDLQFDGHNWFFNTPEIAERFAFISLNQTLTTWGSPENLLVAHWITDITKILWKQDEISHDDIHFNLKDVDLWKKILASMEFTIQELREKALKVNDLFDVIEDEEESSENYLVYYAKFRGVDPLVSIDESLIPLTQISKKYKQDYEGVKQHIHNGWRIKFR